MARRVVDPHFHFWSKSEIYNANLDGIYALFPSYLSQEYLGDASGAVVGAVHVEAIVGQKDGGSVADPIAETRVVVRESSKLGFPSRVVVYVNLSKPDAAEVIEKHRQTAGGEMYACHRRSSSRLCKLVAVSGNPLQTSWLVSA
jgi:predicted TIM-barrel fold metal-dependent hydrolase